MIVEPVGTRSYLPNRGHRSSLFEPVDGLELSDHDAVVVDLMLAQYGGRIAVMMCWLIEKHESRITSR